MAKGIKKMIAVPVDGSANALKSLDYLHLIFDNTHNLKVTLLYVLPSLPPILIEESRKNVDTARQLKEIEKKNIAMAERLLAEAKNRLLKAGFGKEAVETVYHIRKAGIARDICNWSEDKRADALFISSRGRSRLEVFFTGEVANKLLEYMRVCPVWMLKGSVKHKDVLLAIDNSENALRAVDHAGFMLSGTNTKITIFHSKRDLRRFVPKELIEEFPEFKKFWKHKAGEVMAPYLQKAKEMLLGAGLTEDRISIKLIDGSRSAATDIVKEAKRYAMGTVVLGRRGCSDVKDFSMGSVARKVLDQASDMAVCIVP